MVCHCINLLHYFWKLVSGTVFISINMSFLDRLKRSALQELLEVQHRGKLQFVIWLLSSFVISVLYLLTRYQHVGPSSLKLKILSLLFLQKIFLIIILIWIFFIQIWSYIFYRCCYCYYCHLLLVQFDYFKMYYIIILKLALVSTIVRRNWRDGGCSRNLTSCICCFLFLFFCLM